MLCPPHVVLRTCQSRWNSAALEVFLSTQQRKFEFGYFGAAHFVPCPYCAFGVGIIQRMQKVMACRIGVALNNSDAPRHEQRVNRGRFGSLMQVKVPWLVRRAEGLATGPPRLQHVQEEE